MKGWKQLLAVALVTFSTACLANVQPNVPLDFSYRVSGPQAPRPLLVFNDGEDTYIQPAKGSRIVWVKGGAVERSGAYIIVKGVPQKIELVDEHNEVVTLTHQGEGGRAQSIVDLGGGFSARGALPTLGWTGLAPAVPAACGGTQKEESLLAVVFDEGREKLSAEHESIVATAAKNFGATQVLITAPENDGLEVVRERNEYLTGVLESIGVRRNAFQYARGSTVDDATEVMLVKTRTVNCIPGKPIVTNDGKKITVLANQTDASILLNEIAHAMGLKFSIEGPVRFTPIDFEVIQTTHNVALHKLGAAVAAWATVVLRDKELVLRFK